MRRFFLTILLSLLCCTSAHADGEPQLSDFARTMPLSFSPGGAIYELSLPVEVYRWTRSHGLYDVAVFNGRGEVVPFALVTQAAVHTDVAVHPVPVFQLAGDQRESGGNVAVQIRTDGLGAIVNLNTAAVRGMSQPVTGYLIDASSLDKPVAGFDLDLTSTVTNYLGTVRIEVSDDLHQWRYHSSGAVATLTADGKHFAQQRIEFPAVKAKYFRLVPEQNAQALRVSGAAARLNSPVATPARNSSDFVIHSVRGKRGEYLVETDGFMPIDRLRLRFADDNSVAGVTFLSRSDDKSPWCVRACGTFYRLQRDGRVVESPPLEIQPTSDRHWLIKVQHPGGGFGSSLPRMEVCWLPHRLIFTARGAGPFRLAYGSGRTGLDALRDDAIMATLVTWEKDNIKPATATAGPSSESGGKAVLREHIPAATWKRLLLWGALLLGVLLLARMAWHLGREMSLVDANKKELK